MPHTHVKDNAIGSRIKKAREMRGLGQIEVLAALEVDKNIVFSRRVLHRIEHGERPVRDKEIIAFAEILEVDPNWLFNWKKSSIE